MSQHHEMDSADDLHSLNPAAPSSLHPFVNGLSERPDVLSGRKMFQAGVRSAQGIAAMTCGVGTLPYNLSIIRDLDAIPRHAKDPLHRTLGLAVGLNDQDGH